METTPYPVEFKVEYHEKSSRLMALSNILFMIPRALMLIPHAVVLFVLTGLAALVFIASQIIVLFAGSYPRQMFDFTVGVMRWRARVGAFTFGLTDKYPPFSLK